VISDQRKLLLTVSEITVIDPLLRSPTHHIVFRKFNHLLIYGVAESFPFTFTDVDAYWDTIANYTHETQITPQERSFL
jgi:hypothetical protein